MHRDELDGVQRVENVMAHLDMIEQAERTVSDARIYERSRWVRTKLGKIVDPLTDESFEVVAPIAGEVIGMSLPKPVLSGYALYNLAWHVAE